MKNVCYAIGNKGTETMNIKTILNPLFGKVMKDGKRIPDTRIMVFGTRIFFFSITNENDVK